MVFSVGSVCLVGWPLGHGGLIWPFPHLRATCAITCITIISAEFKIYKWPLLHINLTWPTRKTTKNSKRNDKSGIRTHAPWRRSGTWKVTVKVDLNLTPWTARPSCPTDTVSVSFWVYKTKQFLRVQSPYEVTGGVSYLFSALHLQLHLRRWRRNTRVISNTVMRPIIKYRVITYLSITCLYMNHVRSRHGSYDRDIAWGE